MHPPARHDPFSPGARTRPCRAPADSGRGDAAAQTDEHMIADGVDDEAVEANRRIFEGSTFWAMAALATLYAMFHMAALNGLSISALTGIELPFLPQFPMETWNFRIVHVAGALVLGFLMYAAADFPGDADAPGTPARPALHTAAIALAVPALLALGTAIWFALLIEGGAMWNGMDATIKFRETWLFGVPLLLATAGAIGLSWAHSAPRARLAAPDIVLGICAVAVAAYLITIYGTLMRNSTGTPFAPIGISIAAVAGTALIMELTRRVAGLALVIIAGVFLAYVFAGQYLPGFLNSPAISWQRFFSQVYTDAGILGPTTAVSSTYIILFIIFAAFLQASKVGDYFVNFAFAAAGRTRGGPAKVAIFASGLMGMINGTSAGNVVATGSLTIPLMKKVGYHKKTAGAVEAAASTGGQIMPPIMGAGAFIMAEITGIPYTEIAIAAIIPAVLYFVSVFFMVDFEAAKLGMRGMNADEIPKLSTMMRRVFLFLPILILIAALFMGYSVIRAGTYATLSAAVVSWLTPYRMGPRSTLKAFEIAGVMSIQIIAVCACAGIIVGVISLTGVGARFSNLLLGLAGVSQFLALFFAMCISILLGMGMPTTAAYAVAASVVAPGLVELGIPQLTAHFFVFYFAVLSAITPPVALASYAAAGISGANPMETSVASFKIGIAAFIVPFMFFYNGALLMEGTWFEVIRAGATATVGVFLLSAGVQGWFMGGRTAWFIRAGLLLAALTMIEGGLVTDIIGLATIAAAWTIQKTIHPNPDAKLNVKGAD
ncbi:C4-dicarboxylate ABC transporter permease [Meridianimarinicoccus roseus]|uniref:C4-dicarboxylate ABC transporter permease n=2 Tax=Meridianimarinicoccus roseus TaxID=2072018 RepID=A0A2V2LF25_9RHOB|nr:C4-dicarboxylate ABC transporter permease [Meridianimarinicoccus roseus]PWR03101.1 C4-dicarboxylate ABC transporter permease [Meridianimarinicoccus roseus]PWR03676.1 C4-dicarboxylate ABC transporter permease [Meridianimarinicoccus roseus]PWR04218.1 C4-dicarboxylate ABC transporter permease [Meridianimarinicoccus roseus]